MKENLITAIEVLVLFGLIVLVTFLLSGCKSPFDVKTGGNTITGMTSEVKNSSISIVGMDLRNAGMDVVFSSGAFVFKLLERYNQPVVKNDGGINFILSAKYPDNAEVNKTKHILEAGKETIESETIKPIELKNQNGLQTILSIATILAVMLNGLFQILFYNHSDTSVLKRIINFIFRKGDKQ